MLLAASACQASGRSETIAWLQTQGMGASEATLLANNKPALRQYIMNRSLAPQDDAYCRSLGARVGTDVYVQCRTSLAASRQAQDQPRRQRALNCTSSVVFGQLKTRCE